MRWPPHKPVRSTGMALIVSSVRSLVVASLLCRWPLSGLASLFLGRLRLERITVSLLLCTRVTASAGLLPGLESPIGDQDPRAFRRHGTDACPVYTGSRRATNATAQAPHCMVTKYRFPILGGDLGERSRELIR